jgi:hypothetical protein
MSDNTAVGSLEPEVNIHAEYAEHDVKEFLEVITEEILQGEYVWSSALGLKLRPFKNSWKLLVRDWLESSVVGYTIEE